MKRILYVIFVLLLSNNCLLAQQKIEGTYNAGSRTFTPKDRQILVKYFRNDNLAPFMIKGRDPFAADSNHVGFIDTTGRIVIKPDYNNCSYFEGKYALVLIAGKTYRDYKWGVIDKKGKMLIPPEYERLGKCPNGLFEAVKGSKMGFINIHNKIIVPFGKYSAYATPPPIYTEEGDVGHMDFYWDELHFGKSVFFRNYIGVKSGKKWAVIDSTGKEVIPPKFDGMGIFNNNIAPAKIGEKFGVTDSLGNMVIPALYDLIELSGKNYLYVYNGKKVGVVSLSNRLILPIEFSGILPFGDGFTAYNGDGKAILFDADGAQIGSVHNPVSKFPFWGQKDEGFFVYNSDDKKYHSYQNIEDIINEYRGSFRQIFYNRNNAWGLMDATGREITPPLFDGFNRYKLDGTGTPNKYIAVVKDNKWGVIDTGGKVLLSIIYDQIVADRGKLFAEKDEKCGFFSQNLEQLTPMKYDSLVITYPDDLYNPKASAAVVRARINNKWGLINNNGKEIIPFNYDELIWVYADLALVKNNGKYGVANLQGKQTADCVYDDIRYNDRNGGVNYVKSLVTKKDGLYGLINSYGMEVAAPVYDNIIPLFIGFTGKYQVSYHGKVGVLDGAYGQLIIPCVYDDLKFYNNDGAGSYARNWHAHWSPYIIAFKNRYCGLIDSMGKVFLPTVYDRIDFEEDRYYVSLDGKHGVIDENLIWITPPR